MNKRFKYNGGELEFWPETGRYTLSIRGGHGADGCEYKNLQELLKDIDKTIVDSTIRHHENIDYLEKLKNTLIKEEKSYLEKSLITRNNISLSTEELIKELKNDLTESEILVAIAKCRNLNIPTSTNNIYLIHLGPIWP